MSTASYTLTTFGAIVAVSALRGDKTIAEIAEKYRVHPNQVTAWKEQLLERSRDAVGEKADGTTAPNIEKIEAKIGMLTFENEFLESALINAGLLSAKL